MPRGGGESDLVIAGRVLKPYGILGWVKVEVLSSNPRRFASGNSFILEGEEGRKLVLRETKRTTGALLARFDGVETREEAKALAGRHLMITPQQMGEAPEGAYWEHDLLSLRVFTTQGRFLGEVVEVMETGANDVLVVRGERECLIPMIGEVVMEIDLEEEKITINPMPGLLD
ncbi:MAG: 16S rRNA processing protein RimM [Actinobacteria bacterium]|nr:16S rRNA processing protein RimM [Actinomycetota bacterium]